MGLELTTWKYKIIQSEIHWVCVTLQQKHAILWKGHIAFKNLDVCFCIHLFNRYYIYFALRMITWCHALTWLSSQVQNWYQVGAIGQRPTPVSWLWALLPDPQCQSHSAVVLRHSITHSFNWHLLSCSRHVKARAVLALRSLVQTLLKSCPWDCEPVELVFVFTPLQSYLDFLQTLPSLHFSPSFPPPSKSLFEKKKKKEMGDEKRKNLDVWL